MINQKLITSPKHKERAIRHVLVDPIFARISWPIRIAGRSPARMLRALTTGFRNVCHPPLVLNVTGSSHRLHRLDEGAYEKPAQFDWRKDLCGAANLCCSATWLFAWQKIKAVEAIHRP